MVVMHYLSVSTISNLSLATLRFPPRQTLNIVQKNVFLMSINNFILNGIIPKGSNLTLWENNFEY